MTGAIARQCHYGCPGIGHVQNARTLKNGILTRYYRCDSCKGTWAVDYAVKEILVETRSGTPPRKKISSLEI